jgi:hypothetical protein
MSTRREHPRLVWIAVLGVVACCAAAATAFGFVQVYGNNFPNKPSYREIKPITDSDECARDFMESRHAMRAQTKAGPRHCRYRPPAQGSGPQPDHRFDAIGKILKATPSEIRTDAYLSMSVRVGAGERYELRIFPKDKTYELRRKPGGPGFPSAGPNNAIRPIDEANRMRLLVEGARVRAFVNGTMLADITDAQPGELHGAKVEFGVGSERNTNKPTIALFDGLKLSVPTP